MIYYLKLLIVLVTTLNGQIYINELMSSNSSTITDGLGNSSDWIELYNTGDYELDLSGYALSDKIDNPIKWIIPGGTVISANGYITFWCSGRDENFFGNYHTNFTLKQTRNNPEYVVFSDADGIIINAFTKNDQIIK